MAKTVDKLPEPKKDPPKPTPKPAPQAPAAAPAVTAAPASNATAAAAAHKPAEQKPKPGAKPKKGTVARPTEVIELQGQTQFAPGAWGDYIKSYDGEATEVDVKWGVLAPKTSIHMKWDDDLKFLTDHVYQPLPIVQPFFAGLPEKLAPVLFVKIRGDKIDGFAAPMAMRHATALVDALGDPKITSALGLAGFKLPSPKFDNKIQDGHFIFGTEALSFRLGGWINGSLKLGLVDNLVSFTATAHVVVRGLAEADLLVSRDKDGHYTGQVEIAVTIGKASGNVLAKYIDGDVSVTGTIKYQSEKFTGSLTVVVADVAEAMKMARGQLDPDKVMEDEKVPSDEKADKPKKGEKGMAAWGQFDFAFTDWMTGTALGVLDPFGHITIVGKITPAKQIELMKEHAWTKVIPPFPLEITARYGLPYVADVHVGVGFELGAVARIGPAVLTDIVVEGTYSTDPKILQDFAISGAFRISAYAGLNLSVYGFAGLTILKHQVDFVAKLTGKAGIKAYAEAAAKIGYREKADPVAGKKGEAYLQGHLEAAAQPVLGLGGDLEIKLTTPWWSPVSDHTWTWPLFDLEWPLATSLGVGADIDYVIGSGKMPDIKLGQVDFDSSKFMSSMLDDQVPKKSGGAEKEKAGTWKGAEPKAPTEPPSAPPAGPAPKGGGKAQAGTPPGKAGKGHQAPEDAANVPKTKDSSERWLAGMQALAELHQRAEKNPEDSAEVHGELARLQKTYGFTRLEPVLQGDYWVVDAEMNPRNPKKKQHQSIKAKKGAKADEAKKEREPASNMTVAQAKNDEDQQRRYARYMRKSKGQLPFDQWWMTIGRYKPPNEHGKEGDEDHQRTVQAIKRKARARFAADTMHESPDAMTNYKTPGGKTIRITRQPDVWISEGKTNTGTETVKFIYEAARVKADGKTFVDREMDKKKQYDALGIESEFVIVIVKDDD